MHLDESRFDGEIHAVIFDMDGLLLDTERLAYRTWRQAATDCGYDLHDDLFKRLIGRRRKDSDEILTRAFGDRFDLDHFRRHCSILWEQTIADGIPLKAGALELLDALDRSATPRAVATSTGRPSAVRCLTMTGIIDRFDQIVTGDQIQRGKPAPDIFLLAAERLDAAPAHCLVLEDSLLGIEAAHAAGMMPVMIPDLLEPTAEIAAMTRAVFDSLHDVCTLFSSNRRSVVDAQP